MQTIKNKILSKRIYSISFTILLLITIWGCISFGMRPETRLELCWLIKGTDGKVLASYPSPNGIYIIHAVNPYCGQTSYWFEIYDCSTRLDLEFDNRIIRGYEMGGVCDASIKWINNIEFEVTTQSGEKRILFIGDAFGILP